MRKVLLAICIAGLLQSAASASLVGSWVKTTATVSGHGTCDIYTLTVTPNAGETMYGFDISVWDTAAGPATLVDGAPVYADSGDWIGNGAAIGSTTNQAKNTMFFFTSAQIPTTVLAGQDTSDLYLAGATSGAGWSSPLVLLHIITPAGGDAYTVDPVTKALNGVSMAKADENTIFIGAPPTITVAADRHQLPIVFAPEPGTLALLACGLFGLLAYAWRKRK